LFKILNFGHAQRRRLRRVLGFVWDLVLGILMTSGKRVFFANPDELQASRRVE
jgi:hypothetical protein